MRKSKIEPREREGQWDSPEFAEDAIKRSICELNEEINFLASMGYYIVTDSETVSAGDGYFFTQLKPPYFYDKENGR